MSTLALPSQAVDTRPGFWNSVVGKKAVMAVTGVALFGFVLGHLAGNLQVYLGAETLNAYGDKLHHLPVLLWMARIGLLVTVGTHITASVQLAMRKRAARPVAYAQYRATTSSYASRTMYWSGPIILAFIIFHLLHFTFGTVHPSYIEGDVYNNVVTGFQQWPVSLAYIVSMVLLGMHLNHGLWSMFQSLGASHPRYTKLIQFGAQAFAALVVIGNISIPISVMAGIVHL